MLAAFRSGKLASRRYNAIHDKMRPLATAHRPFHYPGWNGPGYPKGAGHGPIVWRYDDKKDKVVQVEGMAYEDLRSPGSDEKSSWQKMLDKDPGPWPFTSGDQIRDPSCRERRWRQDPLVSMTRA